MQISHATHHITFRCFGCRSYHINSLQVLQLYCHTTQYAATNTPRWRHLPSPLPKVGADAHGVYHAVTRRPHRPRKGRRPGAAHVFWLRVPGHEAVVLGSNINSSNSLIVSSESLFERSRKEYSQYSGDVYLLV